AGLDEGLRVTTGSIQPEDHAEVEQPLAKPSASSLLPSSGAAKEPGAEVCPQGVPSVPSGRGALLRQQAVASREDAEVAPGKEGPARALEKGGSQGGSQPELLGPGRTTRSIERVPARSCSVDVAPGPVGKSSREAEGDGAGEVQADARTGVETCPWEESRDEGREAGRAPGEGGREGVPRGPGGELGAEEPPREIPELPRATSEQAERVEGRRAEVCPWEAGEGGRSRAEICPWDTEGTQPEQERLEGGSRQQPVEGGEQPGTGLAAGHPTLPKAIPKGAGAMGSSKGNVCPWEVEDEPRPGAEICPWDEPAAPVGEVSLSQDTRGSAKGESKAGAGGLEGIKAKTKKSQRVESIKAE
ncbi:GP179 protein, partial [Eubucco bourcierii]|nr:GP179 protein [Eubucco bourcierii]